MTDDITKAVLKELCAHVQQLRRDIVAALARFAGEDPRLLAGLLVGIGAEAAAVNGMPFEYVAQTARKAWQEGK